MADETETEPAADPRGECTREWDCECELCAREIAELQELSQYFTDFEWYITQDSLQDDPSVKNRTDRAIQIIKDLLAKRGVAA